MQNNLIGIAFIGIGWWGNILADSAVESGAAKIIGGYAKTSATREAFSHRYQCKDMPTLKHLLNDPDVEAVVIASANSSHKEHALLAARAGKHIHLEKPMALTVSDALEIIKVCKENNVKLHIGQCFRRMPLFRAAKKILDSKKLGIISLATAHFSDKLGLVAGKKSPRWNPTENPGGPLYSYTIHLADLLEFFFGETIAVSGLCSKVGGPSPVEDCASALLHFKNGQIGILSSSYIASNRLEFVIEGTHGTLSFTNKINPVIQPIEGYAGHPPISTEIIDLGINYAEGYKIALREQFTNLAHCIRHGEEPEVSGREGVRALAIMRALLKSNKERRMITLAEIFEVD